MNEIKISMEQIKDAFKSSLSGRIINFRDQFILERADGRYLVLIIQFNNFNGELTKYRYEFVSIATGKRVEPKTTAYAKICSDLPTLKKVSDNNNIINAAKNRILFNRFSKLYDSLLKKKYWTPKEHVEYYQYLAEMKDIKSQSFKLIYDYFMGTKCQ